MTGAVGKVTVTAERARNFLTDLFTAAGATPQAALAAADGLVEAELQGVASHGVLQAPNYLRRLRAGTISGGHELTTAHESGAITVFDSGLALGHAVAREVMERTVGKASHFGIAASAVRSATHFGIAGRYARVAAEAGMVGIVMCNTRPMLPAPGGRKPVVGTNPIAIAVPAAGRPPIVFDMAMSATAMGKVRMAAQRGEPIPSDWALDADGRPTTDAKAAIAGMLLPAAGAKGFGLALMVDMLSALSGGSAGAGLKMMYGDPAQPADCSWLMIAIDPAHFGLPMPYAERVAALAAAVRDSGGEASLPGDRKLAAELEADGTISVPAAIVAELEALSRELGRPSSLQPPAA